MSQATLEQLDQDRSDAIAESGWGQKFTLYQPRNLAFWVYSGLVSIGAIIFFGTTRDQLSLYAPTFALAVVVFTLYGAVFWWFTVRLDRYSSIPAKLLVAAFFWGGFAATWVMAARSNDALRVLWGKWISAEWALSWAPGVIAPFTEEPAKGIGLLLLIAMAPHVIRSAFDGFVVGAFIGLGFQLLEDIQYVMGSAGSQFGANQIQASLSTFGVRIGSGFIAHILYSAIFCAGLVYFLGRPSEPRRRGRGLALMASSMVLHGLWDSAGGFGSFNGLLTMVVWVVVFVASLLLVRKVFQMTVVSERELMRTVLAPEVERGIITADELEAASGTARQRRKFVRASGHGKGTMRQGHLLLDATFDLADELGRAGGRESKRVLFARSEVDRIRARH